MSTNSNEAQKRTPAISVEVLRGENGIPDAVVFTSATGETLKQDLRKLTICMQMECMAHGLKQKVVDAGAILRNTETGASASVADKWNAAKSVFERVAGGVWNAVREGGGSNEGGMLVQALCRVYGKTPEQIKSYLATKSDAEKASLRVHAKIAPVLAEIRVENAKRKASPISDADLDAELDNL